MRIAVGAATVFLAVLGGCNIVPSTAEHRAREFVEIQLHQPADAAERLRMLAEPEPLIEGVATGVALDYLRARVRQDADPGITTGATHKPGPGERVVVVTVSPGPGRGAKEDRVAFHVRLARDPEHGWRVRGMRVE